MPAGGGSARVVAEKKAADAAKAKAAADAAKAAAAAKSKPPAGSVGSIINAGKTVGGAITKATPKAGGVVTPTTAAPKPSATPQGTGDLSGLGIGNSSNLGDLFPGADPTQIDTLLTYGGYGEALRYRLGLIEADLLKLKNEADAANQRAQVALDQGKLDLARQEEAHANAIKVQQNVLTEQQQRFTAQGQYADSLMKLGEAPENAYRYAFARYGLQAPEGSNQMLALPEPDAVKPLLKNPNAVNQPAPVSTVPPPQGGSVAGLLPGNAAPQGQPAPRPWPVSAPAGSGPTLAGDAGRPPNLPMPSPGALGGATPAPNPTQTMRGPADASGIPTGPGPAQMAGFAQGGIAGEGMHPMEEGLMKHAMDMAKQGGALLKHHFGAPPAGQGQPQGGMSQLMPPTAPPPYGSGAPGLPQYAAGGVAGLAGGLWRGPRDAHGIPTGPGPAQLSPLFDSPVQAQGPPVISPSQTPARPTTNPYGMPNENQNLGGYSGPMLTLPPYLQQLFAQTGHQESGVPINAPPSWMMPHLGTPSAQSQRFLSPDEQANEQGFERDIEGKPIDTLKSDIAQHADQGSGLEVPHSFALGGIAGLPSGTPQPGALAAAGLPPQLQGIYPAFAAGGVAGTQVSQGPGIFGEAGPEAAVPLNSPGGPTALQALALNQGGAQGGPPNLAAAMGPTSTDIGGSGKPSQAILPLTNIPTQRLGPGQRSEAVGQLQQALEQAGYLQMPPSANYGFYGPVTVHAVRRFQQDQAITAGDLGVWNKQSAAALKSLLQGAGSEPVGPSPYNMRGAGAPGDQTGPQPGPAAAGGPLPPGGPGGLGGMMPSLGM